jgi:hypothetical protein
LRCKFLHREVVGLAPGQKKFKGNKIKKDKNLQDGFCQVFIRQGFFLVLPDQPVV